ncbi:hypothetical protein LRS06_02465 [Hymenobacter sp. J193]|uniref:hypothetical protein n=1 Tax=Hymenobacter sp. J193 TaxID=2898429 RepID=UPI002151D0EE|nr:hypothetical protein [Hymenobacter sp. J193]MCR5886655.1 hypothetical protein [Hymenobacter sp. J193]
MNAPVGYATLAYPNCLWDNLIFAIDGTYLWDFVGTTYDPSFPITVHGEWPLLEKSTYLTMQQLDSLYPETCQMVEASGATLALFKQESGNPQVQTVIRFKVL